MIAAYGVGSKLAKPGSAGLTHMHCVTELHVLGAPSSGCLVALVELPAGAGNDCRAAALGQEIPGRLSLLAEGSGVTGKREIYQSQHKNLVTLLIQKVF